MVNRQEFERIMAAQTAIALATSLDGKPNVRVVNFYYEPAVKTLYFLSFADNQKVQELTQNPYVAFTTISTNGEEHVRVGDAVACKSTVPVEEIKERFLAKLPEHLIGIPDLLPKLVLFEVTFEQADVVLDFEHMGTIAV